MTSTISSNKAKNPFLGMMLWSIKKALPVTVVYSFLLFIVFPVMTLIAKKNYLHTYDYVRNDVVDSFAPFIIIVFSIVIALMMFNIYHNKRSIDLYASFPIKKQTLFLARYFSGLVVLLVPLIVFMIINLFASSQINSASVFITFYKLIGYIVGAINIYSMISFLAMVCGSIVDTIVSFAVVNIGIVSCAFLGMVLVSSILPGFDYIMLYGFEQYIYMAFFLFCPVSMPYLTGLTEVVPYEYKKLMPNFIDTEILKVEAIYMVIWLLLAVGYFVAAMMIAKKRKNENVQNGFIYSFPKVVIQTIASVGAGLILGWGFAEAFSYQASGFKTMVAFMIGALLGSFAAFFIVTLIYNRGIKKLVKSLPIFAGSFVVIAVFYLVISLGLVGINNVPKVEDIQSVAVYSGDHMDFSGYDHILISRGKDFEEVEYFSEDREYINNVVNLHQSIVDNIHNAMGTFFNFYAYTYTYSEEGYNPHSIEIVYKLNNGKEIVKTYSSVHYIYSDIFEQYNTIVSSDIYKNQNKLALCSDAEEANVGGMVIYEDKVYTDKEPISYDEFLSGEFIDELPDTEPYDSKNLDDSELLNNIYTSLREEYLADKNVGETLKAAIPTYVEPTNDNASIYDEIAYNLNIMYNSDIDLYNYRNKPDYVDYSSEYTYTVDLGESYTVTKDTYPKTFELLNNYFEQQDQDKDIFLVLHPN